VTYTREQLNAAHKDCTANRDAINASRVVGCFYCEATYPPGDVREYVCGGKDAVCPKCGIDSVLAQASGYDLSAEFLSAMHERWFGDEEDVTVVINAGEL